MVINLYKRICIDNVCSTKEIKNDLTFEIKNDSPENISESIEQLEKEMYKCAKETEFEKAAFCRDKIKDLKYQLINF